MVLVPCWAYAARSETEGVAAACTDSHYGVKCHGTCEVAAAGVRQRVRGRSGKPAGAPQRERACGQRETPAAGQGHSPRGLGAEHLLNDSRLRSRRRELDPHADGRHGTPLRR